MYTRSIPSQKSTEVRFAFGKNWRRFLRHLDEDRINEAVKSLRTMLDVEDLRRSSFLDIGCGSGLFSLAAMRLGAAEVHSFDYDPESKACAEELKRRYCNGVANWSIEQGSVLDPNYLTCLGQFDVVYSWGVLHHTGNMWQALENVAVLVKPHGRLFIALYNDQGARSRYWAAVKKSYSKHLVWRVLIMAVLGAYFVVGGFIGDLVRFRNPVTRYRKYHTVRGMSYFTDLLDWIGGYPFEVAKPEAVVTFFQLRGFELDKLNSVGAGPGNNEFVFSKRKPVNPQ